MINTKMMRSIVFKKLSKLQSGNLQITDNGTHKFGQDQSGPSTEVIVHKQAFYKKLATRGSIGATESYIKADWSCSNLTALMQLFLSNQNVMSNVESGFSAAFNWLGRMRILLSFNRIKKSKKNILAHYDLSNDLFKLFLDKQNQYSCARFKDTSWDLDRAQNEKLKMICDKLQLREGDHLLEIGTGWGGLAIFAAQNYRCNVTTTTISDAQHAYVKDEIVRLKLDSKITLLKKDYRLLNGTFDKLVSIEMIEAVGHQYFNTYFTTCNKLVKKGGLFLLQAITINDHEYERYKREIDFIKSYIFPGGCLPCIGIITKFLKTKTTLCVRDIEDLGKDYALTLEHWRQRFTASKKEIIKLGFNEEFFRLFEFYFCYCEAGFLSGYISTVQILMEKR
jgi:cyclopropane-fatty-acyl-phospholipid synthase